MSIKNVLRLKIILGSTRPGRFSEHAGAWALEQTKKNSGIEAEILDLRDYEMPFYNETVSPSYKQAPYKSEAVEKWSKKIGEADGFIIISPEYNHGTAAVLKNALDYVFKEWNNKPVGFVAYGSVGGARAVEQLRLITVELQMIPIRNAVHINAPWLLRDEAGNLKPGALDSYQGAIDGLLAQLIFWTKALKNARDIQS